METLSEKEILERIPLGEDSLMEFKSVRLAADKIIAPDARQIANELAAMANSVSGRIVLGVNDKTFATEPLSARVNTQSCSKQ